MPKESIFYPNRPWPVDQLRTHPRFEALLMVDSNHKEAPLKYAMIDILGKFPNGGTLSEFMSVEPAGGGTTRSVEIKREVVEELIRMRVYVMDYSGTEARLIPATVAAVNAAERVKHRSVSINMPLAMVDQLKAAAERRHQSVSGLVVQALEEFLAVSAA